MNHLPQTQSDAPEAEASSKAVSRSRSGVAMFVVLGAILVMTLLGIAGMSLAHKDQTLALDVQDLRSRDAAVNAGFQLALNALGRNASNLVAQLDTFVATNGPGSTPKTWLDFSKTPVELVASQPDFHALSTNGDQTGARVQIVALSVNDAAGYALLTLRTEAQGRHGDRQDGIASFRIDGIGRKYSVVNSVAAIPEYAAYLGTKLGSNNAKFNIEGGTYVGSTLTNSNDVGLNSGGNLTLTGTFKWNGDLPFTVNAGMTTTFNGPTYIRNGLRFNDGQAKLVFNDDLGVEGGVQQFGSDLTGKGRLWISGGCLAAGGCASNGRFLVSAEKGLAIQDIGNYSQYYFSLKSLSGDIWLGGGFRTGAATATDWTGDSIVAGRDFNMLPATVPWNFKPVTKVKVGGLWLQTQPGSGPTVANQIHAASGTFTMGTAQMVNLDLATGVVFQVAGKNHFGEIHGGGLPSGPTESPSWVLGVQAFPSATAFGLPLWLTKTAIADNPPDSVLVRADNAPLVYNEILKHPFSSTGMAAFTACELSRWYREQSAAGKLFNGQYALVLLDKDLDIPKPGANNCADNEVSGKFLFLVRARIYVNGNWPASKTKNDIQVVSVEGPASVNPGKGNLADWGFSAGNFYGVVFWDDPVPDGSNITMRFGTGLELHGAIILTPSRTTPAASLNPNAGDIKIVKDRDVFVDIATYLPGVMKPGADKDGNNNGTNRETFTVSTSMATSNLRAITSKVGFVPLGLYR